MFRPKYQVLLSKKHFPLDRSVCLGNQLISIIESLNIFLPTHVWYGTNIDAIGQNATNIRSKNHHLTLIGSDYDFIQYCSGIDQFIWGVFVCTNIHFVSENVKDIDIATEDDPFRPIPCDGILLEIRTFDTSSFEIYTEDKKITETISTRFNVIEETPNE